MKRGGAWICGKFAQIFRLEGKIIGMLIGAFFVIQKIKGDHFMSSAVICRFKLRPEQERSYCDYWNIISVYFIKHRNAVGKINENAS